MPGSCDLPLASGLAATLDERRNLRSAVATKVLLRRPVKRSGKPDGGADPCSGACRHARGRTRRLDDNRPPEAGGRQHTRPDDEGWNRPRWTVRQGLQRPRGRRLGESDDGPGTWRTSVPLCLHGMGLAGTRVCPPHSARAAMAGWGARGQLGREADGPLPWAVGAGGGRSRPVAAWLGGGDAETVVDDPGGVGARFPDPGDETAMGRAWS